MPIDRRIKHRLIPDFAIAKSARKAYSPRSGGSLIKLKFCQQVESFMLAKVTRCILCTLQVITKCGLNRFFENAPAQPLECSRGVSRFGRRKIKPTLASVNLSGIEVPFWFDPGAEEKDCG